MGSEDAKEIVKKQKVGSSEKAQTVANKKKRGNVKEEEKSVVQEKATPVDVEATDSPVKSKKNNKRKKLEKLKKKQELRKEKKMMKKKAMSELGEAKAQSNKEKTTEATPSPIIETKPESSETSVNSKTASQKKSKK